MFKNPKLSTLCAKPKILIKYCHKILFAKICCLDAKLMNLKRKLMNLKRM